MPKRRAVLASRRALKRAGISSKHLRKDVKHRIASRYRRKRGR